MNPQNDDYLLAKIDRDRRRNAVDQMRASFGHEGLSPTIERYELEEKYVAGVASIQDLLNAADKLLAV